MDYTKTGTPVERFLSAMRRHGFEVKQSGSSWSACCPAHEDRSPSLSIAEGDDGRALIKCHVGCDVKAICSAIGLQVTDLMPTADSLQRAGNKPKGTVYATANQAVAALENQLGKRSHLWTYHDANAKPVGLVVRWNQPNGKKTFRPVSLFNDGWQTKGMPVPRPLYGLHELATADRVLIVEGEKTTDALRAIDFVATTSPNGSKSVKQTDWSPLAGKSCVLWPDNDEPGDAYAEEVAAIIGTLSPPATVRIIRPLQLPNGKPMPEGGDAFDWIEEHGEAVEPEAIAAAVNGLIDAAKEVATTPIKPIERFEPFPTDVLPEPIRGFVESGAKAIGCDSSFIALPLLTALASAIGNTRRIELKAGWTAPAILWVAIVGESGTSKTPAFKLALRALRKRQATAMKRLEKTREAYQEDLAHFEKAKRAWKNDKKTTDPPPKEPEPPHVERFIVNDTTVEALAPLLLENPRGLLLARDELAGWFGSFDRYASGGGGADASHWLSMHNSETITVDRKTGVPRTIIVPRASVSVAGGIQPKVLHRALGNEHRESGLAARFLLAWPSRKPKKWTEAKVAKQTTEAVAKLFDRLFELEQTVDNDGEAMPVVVKLTDEAKTVWINFYNAHAKEQNELKGELSAAWSKLEEYPARLALVVHFVRWATGDSNLLNENRVDDSSMKAGIELVQWFKREARRIYPMLSESDEAADQRQLVDWIECKGGSVTAREVQQGHRQYQTAVDAETALDELANAGHGAWQTVSPAEKGGRPKRVFQLIGASTSTQPRKSRVLGGCVDVDSVDERKTTLVDALVDAAESEDRGRLF